MNNLKNAQADFEDLVPIIRNIVLVITVSTCDDGWNRYSIAKRLLTERGIECSPSCYDRALRVFEDVFVCRRSVDDALAEGGLS